MTEVPAIVNCRRRHSPAEADEENLQVDTEVGAHRGTIKRLNVRALATAHSSYQLSYGFIRCVPASRSATLPDAVHSRAEAAWPFLEQDVQEISK
jgi:hypothetical protein